MTSAGPVRASKPSPQPELLAAWPRSAQWATAFLLGTTVALLFVHFAGSWRWGARPSELQAGAATSARLDLNQAERIELLQLPGVGPNLATRIESYRQTHGPFRSVDDLSNVSGIGPATLERLRPLLVVESEEGRQESALAMKHGAVEAAAPISARDPTAGASAARPFFDKPPKILPTEPIDLNRATLDELQRLPRIGPKLAERILQARTKKPFQEVGDLRRVSGIGPKTLEQLRPFVFIARAE